MRWRYSADGKVNSNFVSAMAQGRDVALQSDEKRGAAGYINHGSNTEFAVAHCHDGVVLSTDATLNELTASGSTKGVTGHWRSRRTLFPPHDYQATVPHTTAYPSLTPMANDWTSTLRMIRSDSGLTAAGGPGQPVCPAQRVKSQDFRLDGLPNQLKDPPTPRSSGASAKGTR